MSEKIEKKQGGWGIFGAVVIAALVLFPLLQEVPPSQASPPRAMPAKEVPVYIPQGDGSSTTPPSSVNIVLVVIVVVLSLVLSFLFWGGPVVQAIGGLTSPPAESPPKSDNKGGDK